MNRWLQNQIKQQGFTYIKLYPNFLDSNKEGLKKSFTTDGIHLTQKAYSLWEKILRDKIN